MPKRLPISATQKATNSAPPGKGKPVATGVSGYHSDLMLAGDGGDSSSDSEASPRKGNATSLKSQDFDEVTALVGDLKLLAQWQNEQIDRSNEQLDGLMATAGKAERTQVSTKSAISPPTEDIGKMAISARRLSGRLAPSSASSSVAAAPISGVAPLVVNHGGLNALIRQVLRNTFSTHTHIHTHTPLTSRRRRPTARSLSPRCTQRRPRPPRRW